MKKNIKKSLILSLIGLTSCATVAVTLTSCKTNVNANLAQHKVTIDVMTNTELLNDKWTIDDWIKEFQNLNLQSPNIKKLLEIVNKELQTQGVDRVIQENEELIISTRNKEYNNNISGNLNFTIYSNNNLNVDVTLQNLYVYSDSIFTPPEQNIVNQEQEFEQVNLSSIANISYEKISDASWTNAINATKNGQGFIIPPTIYVLKEKTLKDDGKSYHLVYGLSDIYESQVDLLSNKDSFKDVKIKIVLSPYIGKLPKTDFTLDQQAINKYFGNNGSNITIDEVKAMDQKTIYEKLQKYVIEAEPNVEPLRNCVDKNDPNKIIDFSSSSNIVGNQNQLTIQFKSNGVKTYAYKFTLNFT